MTPNSSRDSEPDMPEKKPSISAEELLAAALKGTPEPEEGPAKYDVKGGQYVEMPGENDGGMAP
jgi:hypothetical protein